MRNDELTKSLKASAAEGTEIYLDFRQGHYLPITAPYEPTSEEKGANGYQPDEQIIVIPAGISSTLTNLELTTSLKSFAGECEIYLADREPGYVPTSHPYRPSSEHRTTHGHLSDKLMLVIPAEGGLSE